MTAIAVHELVSKHLEDNGQKQTWLLKKLEEHSIKMSTTKLYGLLKGYPRSFNKKEVTAINKILKTKFPLPQED